MVGFWLIWKLERQTNRMEDQRRDRWYRYRICLVSQKHFSLNTVDLPREIDPEMLSPPSDADASNQFKVANVLPPGQKCTYTVMTGWESRASVPKMHSGNSSQNCTYMVRLGCKSRTSVPKMHPNCTYMVILGCKSRASVPKMHPDLIEASEGDDIVVSWQGYGRLLANLETR